MKIILSATFLLFTLHTSAQIITTVAGNGTTIGVGAYTGDGGPALSATLGDMYYCYPAFDNAGNMYIAQNGNNTIRKVDVNGIITTIAGTPGVIGYSGDGGPAINALLYHPTAIAIDNNNNIFFADANGVRIRKIDAAGIITTVSGQHLPSCGVGDGGPLSSARFYAISSLTFDANNNLYITDYGCNTVRKVNTAGVITTVAGNGSSGFSGDGGPATAAKMAYPTRTSIDNAGNLYIADAQNHRIRKVSPAGIISTVFGTGVQGYSGDGGPALLAQFAFPGSIEIDNAGNFYIGDYNHVIRKVDATTGIITTYAGTGIGGYTGDGGPATLAQIYLTEGRISVDDFNNIFFVNYYSGVIRKISNCLAAQFLQHPINSTLCNSGNTSFQVNVTNEQSLKWQVNTGSGWTDITNNTIYSGANSNTLIITGAVVSMNNYQYRCVATNTCGNISSNIATLFVNTQVTPSVSITTPTNSVCSGTPVTFTATPTNEGNVPFYQWKKNGINVGTNSTIYVDNSLISSDIITCVLTSNLTCVTSQSTTSNPLSLSVTPVVTPTVNITASANNICYGTPVTFTASPINGGPTPVYIWRRNNVVTGSNSPVYTDNTLSNTDVIHCELISSAPCASPTSILSTPIFMTVYPTQNPTIAIAASQNPSCKNSTVNFTATISNGGAAPIYNWKLNGVTVGSGNSYSTNSVNTGDVISCELTSTASCANVNTVSSNTIIVSKYNDPVVNLNDDPQLCEGATRTLNAGSFSSYLWHDGSTASTFNFNSTGTYYVTVTDMNGCKGSDTVNVSSLLPKPVGFLGKDTTICSYGNLVLKSTKTFSQYSWQNGVNNNWISITQPGTYWLDVKDNNNCTGRDSIIVSLKNCMKGLYVPTGFTPNNDGKNDLLRPLLFGNVRLYEFRIYSRWGETVFQSTTPGQGWNGKYKKLTEDSNVFIWTCKYQLENEPVKFEKGTFVLLR